MQVQLLDVVKIAFKPKFHIDVLRGHILMGFLPHISLLRFVECQRTNQKNLVSVAVEIYNLELNGERSYCINITILVLLS